MQPTPRRIPAARYRSREWHDLEAQRLWPRVWQIACTVDCVRESGDWFEYQVGALSILVVRGNDGELRAVAQDGQGSSRPARMGLLPVQVGAWGGFVFVNADPDAEPLDAFIETDHLHAIHPQMLAIADDLHTPITLWDRHSKFVQPYGVASPRLTAGASDQEIWQEFVRNLGHRLGIPFAASGDPGPHPALPAGGTIRDLLVDRIRAHLRSLGDPYPGLSDERLIDDSHYHLFPNSVMNVFAGWFGLIRARPGPQPDMCLLDMWNFDWLPEGDPKRHCRPEQVTLAPDGIAPLGEVMRQDIENLPRVQKGLAQPGLHALHLSLAESRIGRMHQVLDRTLGTSLEDELRAAGA